MTQRKTALSARNAAKRTKRPARSPRRRANKRTKTAPSTRADTAQYVRLVREITSDCVIERVSIPAIATPDGEAHFYLNAAVPRDANTGQPLAPITTGICAVCGHAYADLIRKAAKIAQMNAKNPDFDPVSPENRLVCDECKGDAWFDGVLELESAVGLRLDTGTAHGRDLRFEREKYDYKFSQTRQIQHLANEHNSQPGRQARTRRAHDND